MNLVEGFDLKQYLNDNFIFIGRKMRPEIKELILEDLRSGENKQTKGFLAKKQNDGEIGYCCLGRMCEVANNAGINVDRHTTLKLGQETITYCDTCHYLPMVVKNWIISENDFVGDFQVKVTPKCVPGDTMLVSLSELNDGTGEFKYYFTKFMVNMIYTWTFEQIADFIEVAF